MVYGTVTIRTVPGKRFAGIAKLKELAEWMSEKYGVRTQILGNVAGQIYVNHIVTQHESMAQAEESWAKLVSDPEYVAWQQSAEGLLAWESATTSWYNVID
jgi:GTP cyclohydrolase I